MARACDDLPLYISQYEGAPRITRLLYIAKRSSDGLQLQACQMLIKTLMQGKNPQMYLDCVSFAREQFGDALGNEYGLDQDWVAATNRSAQETLSKLSAKLEQAKKIGDKSPIVACAMELAKHHELMGNYGRAMTSYLEAKSNANDVQDAEASLAIMRASIDVGSYTQVKSQAQRIQMSKVNPKPPQWGAEVLSGLGLFYLKHEKFLNAANNFLKAPIDANTRFSPTVSTRDVAVYACLCALASFTRQDVKRHVLEDASFNRMFEIIPEWKVIVHNYCIGNYAQCFKALAGMEQEMVLDAYLGPLWVKLYATIMDRAFVLYFRPFSSVKLDSMAKAFCIDPQVVENRVIELISRNEIQARIDKQNKVLYARHADTRSATFARGVALGDKYIRDVKSLIMRTNLVADRIVVSPGSDDSGPWKGGTFEADG